MNIFKSIVEFHKVMMKPHSGVSHKRYIAINAFYAILFFGILDLSYDVPEVLYLILAGLAGLEGAMSLFERRRSMTEIGDMEKDQNDTKEKIIEEQFNTEGNETGT